jgi:hypothetical protein
MRRARYSRARFAGVPLPRAARGCSGRCAGRGYAGDQSAVRRHAGPEWTPSGRPRMVGAGRGGPGIATQSCGSSDLTRSEAIYRDLPRRSQRPVTLVMRSSDARASSRSAAPRCSPACSNGLHDRMFHPGGPHHGCGERDRSDMQLREARADVAALFAARAVSEKWRMTGSRSGRCSGPWKSTVTLMPASTGWMRRCDGRRRWVIAA